MKTIYFVRHGESTSNIGQGPYDPDSSLTEEGRKQADVIAERCSHLRFETVLCSTLRRARETTEAITRVVGTPVEYSDLFVEKRRPSAMSGMDKTSDEWSAMLDEVTRNFSNPGYRHSDEDNFEDLRERAGRALDMLAARDEEALLVVTHANFLRVMLARALFGANLTGADCSRFDGMRMKNTGLSVFTYDKENATHPWMVITWNDHAHLG